MKPLFWLLILFNFGLFAYFNAAYFLPSNPQLKHAEINPEKITLLSPIEIAALPKKADGATITSPAITLPAINTCHAWGIFSDANLTAAQSAITTLALNATIKEQSSQQAKRFWVYRAPLKSTQEAMQKAAEFKALGVEDLFVVQEAKWKNAISFGIFTDETLAINLQKELQAKGVKNVEKALRSQGKSYSSLILHNLTENNITEIKKLKPSFPAADLKEVSCE